MTTITGTVDVGNKTAGVNSFNGASGSIGYAPVFSVSNIAALTALPTLGSLVNGGLQTGQEAYVATSRAGGEAAVYVLRLAVSTAPDSFFVVPTSDDATRQWVHSSIQEQSVIGFISSELDLKQTQTVTLIPPISYKHTFTQAFQWIITAKDGTVNAGPTTQVGTDAGISNIYTSAVQAITGVALNAQSPLTTAGSVPNNLDLSANGIRLQITSGATLGTATVFKARVRFLIALNKY